MQKKPGNQSGGRSPMYTGFGLAIGAAIAEATPSSLLPEPLIR